MFIKVLVFSHRLMFILTLFFPDLVHRCYKVRFCTVQIGHINQLMTYLMLLSKISIQPIPNKIGKITVAVVSVVVSGTVVVIIIVVVVVETADI